MSKAGGLDKMILQNLPNRINLDLSVVHSFDELRLRTRRKPSPALWKLLKRNCRKCYESLGEPIVRGLHQDKKRLLRLVAPNATALDALMAEFGCDSDAIVNDLHVCTDIITKTTSEALSLRDLFDRHLVIPWHKHSNRLYETCTYSGPEDARVVYCWYADKLSKRTLKPCLHLEGRHEGLGNVQRLGVSTVADLLTFDHEAYWRRGPILCEVDLALLGRQHSNRQSDQRRRNARIARYQGIQYNFDYRAGLFLLKSLGQVTALSDTDDREGYSLQGLVDWYGRGRWLRKIATVDCQSLCD